MFFTYDEHGGFYDHVASAGGADPDGIPPMLAARRHARRFDHYGVRVPVAVISPYSKPHFVSHVVDDHTSILRFIEYRFGLPSLTNRDAPPTRCSTSSTSPTRRSRRRRRWRRP